MSIYIPARSPEDWRYLLADPVKHWVPKHSAKELAYAWHRKPGFPGEVARILQASGLPVLQSAEQESILKIWPSAKCAQS